MKQLLRNQSVSKLISFSFLFSASISASLLMSSCTKSDDDDEGNDASGNGNEEIVEGEFRTDCGVVRDGKLVNPVQGEDGIPARIRQIVSENVIIVRPTSGSGDILVKLHGLANQSSLYEKNVALATISESSGDILVFEAAKGCSTRVEGGGTAMVASVLDAFSGDSLAEGILQNGGGDIAQSDACSGELLTSCFQALEEEGEENNPPLGETASNFLWKPESERDGNVAVLLSPKSTVTANGETLNDTGPSNGRATTARGNKPGCAYGKNVRVEAIDEFGRNVVFPGGTTSYVIPDGCDQ